MLSENIDILTPLSKVHRVSRPILDRTNFTVEAGQWVALAAKTAPNYVSGAVVKASAGTSAKVYELVLNGSRASNIVGATGLGAYESSDTKVGRITTLMEPGVRVTCGLDLLTVTATASINVGDNLTVSVAASTAGLLSPIPTDAGDYEAVAVVTGVTGTEIEYRMVPQFTIKVAS